MKQCNIEDLRQGNMKGVGGGTDETGLVMLS